MSHRFRVSSSRQIEIINQSLEIYEEMKTHLESCTLCDDDNGICASGLEVLGRQRQAQQRLRQIGFEQ